MDVGLINDYNKLVFIHPFSNEWNLIPEKYRTKDNFDTYCYMRYMGMDAYSMFMEKINKYEK
jgi:hypothetical protein